MSAPGYALITGASSGIGECFARALAKRGRNVILAARSAEKLKTLAEELAAAQAVRAEVFPCDLSEAGAGSALAEAVRERGLEVDLLINNAGFGARGEFWKYSLPRALDMIRLHLHTMVELSYALVPTMIQRREGAVINVSSMTGFQPMPYAALYAATKAFMTSFSLGLAEELRPYRITVVTLCPGGTRTNFVTEGEVQNWRRFPGRAQAPEEVVNDALRALDLGGGLVVPGLNNKLMVFAQRFLPRELVPKIVARMSRP